MAKEQIGGSELANVQANSIKPSTYLERIKKFCGSHKKELAYGGVILAFTIVGGLIGYASRPVSIPEGEKIIASANEEFEISYICVPNRSPDPLTTKHIEVAVTSPTYRTPDDPQEVLQIMWDKPSYADRYQRRAQGPGEVPPRLFEGRRVVPFDITTGYGDFQKFPYGSMAEVEVVKGRVKGLTNSEIEVVSFLSATVPRRC